MKIGIVTTWFERGAAYVSRTYMDMFVNLGHEVLIYARGGDGKPAKDLEKWNESYVTRDNKYNDTQINLKKFYGWIEKNKIELILFNEQQHFLAPAMVKKKFPNVMVAAYVDYYTERMLPLFHIYDFVICNTYRHLQAMQSHPQAYYLKWCVDTELYRPTESSTANNQVTFFHSVGMSPRKGTDILLEAYIDGELFKNSKLVIHTQIPISRVCKYDESFLKSKGIEIVEKTVGAPGLYHMGDVYVYPTRLDGLGLTMYEALSCGMPVITTDYPPMNEAVTSDVGSLVKPADHYCRGDAYYFPMTVCDKNDLIVQMKKYIDNPALVTEQGKRARERALNDYSFSAMQNHLDEILHKATVRPMELSVYNVIRKEYGSPILSALKQVTEDNNRIRTMKSTIYKIGLRK